MKKIVLATHNKGKIKEMADLVAELGLEVMSAADFDVPDVEETGTTFVENAIIKARHSAKITGLPAIADDSGLEVDHLKGAPGIYSARYASMQRSMQSNESKEQNENQLLSEDQLNINALLAVMEGVPEEQRTARFHCVLVFMRHEADPTPLICQGVWEGKITTSQQGLQGFGYDPIFSVAETNCTSAELPSEVKKAMSHRGKALKQLLAQLSASLASHNADPSLC